MHPHDFDRFWERSSSTSATICAPTPGRHGLRLNVQDPDAQRDIDVEADRLTVRVDGDFRIKQISVE